MRMAHVLLIYATLELYEDLIKNKHFMTISIFAFKGELNAKILLFCFFFVGYTIYYIYQGLFSYE